MKNKLVLEDSIQVSMIFKLVLIRFLEQLLDKLISNMQLLQLE